MYFTMHGSKNVNNTSLLPIIKTKEIHYFSHLFWYRTLHVSDGFTVHHQESILYTQQYVFIILVMLNAC